MEILELIDCKLKGNSIRLYFGKNGEQRGDDWDDVPYEYNASKVDKKFVRFVLDMIINFDYEVYEPSDNFPMNSPYCRNDFISRKVFAFEVIPFYDDKKKIEIYFGDSLQDILVSISKVANKKIVKIYN